jgi:hypothetical protein
MSDICAAPAHVRLPPIATAKADISEVSSRTFESVRIFCVRPSEAFFTNILLDTVQLTKEPPGSNGENWILEMKTFFLVLLLIVLLCASALGLLIAFPFFKEGSSWGDMPVFASVAGAALLLAFVWWFAVGQSLPKALIGWTILFVPLFVHGSIIVSLIIARFDGEHLSKTIQIDNFWERPLHGGPYENQLGV